MKVTTEIHEQKTPKPLFRLITPGRQRPLPLYDGKWSLADEMSRRQRLGGRGIGNKIG